MIIKDDIKIFYDIEVFSNYFLLCYKIGDKDDYRFIEFESDMDIKEIEKNYNLLCSFWNKRKNALFVGYNTLRYDNLIIERIVNYGADWIENSKTLGIKINDYIHDFNQSIINDRSNDYIGISKYKKDNEGIYFCDLFCMLGFDNDAKSTSLKWIEFMLDMDVIDIYDNDFTKPIKKEDIENVKKYCKYDVLATYTLFNNCIEIYNQRKEFSIKYNDDYINTSASRFGGKYLKNEIIKKIGSDELKKRIKNKTTKGAFYVKEILPERVLNLKFNKKEFKEIWDSFHNTKMLFDNGIVTEIEGNTKITKKIDGYEFAYGKGGLHQSMTNMVFDMRDDFYKDYMILDMDVTSLYPSIVIEYGLYPKHVGKEFLDIYSWIVSERKKEKKKGDAGDKLFVALAKEAANSAIGQSNLVTSWMYDPTFFFAITITGQKIVSYLIEKMMLGLKDMRLIQSNTDGITILIKKKDYEKAMSLSKEWMQETGMELEFKEYERMYIWNVSNYIAITGKEKDISEVKTKGAFSVYEFKKKDAASLHKNKSYLVIYHTILKHLYYNIPVEEAYKSITDIHEWTFCIKSGRNKNLEKRWQYVDKNTGNLILTKEKVNRMIRGVATFFGKGFQIYRTNKNGIISNVEFSDVYIYDVTDMTNIKDIDPHNNNIINHKWYLLQIKKQLMDLKTEKKEILENLFGHV